MIELLRIDDKLVHSQMIWGWVPALRAYCIIVANDEVARDKLRRDLLTAVVQNAGSTKQNLAIKILSLEEAVKELKCQKVVEKSILVVSKPTDVVFLLEKGVPIRNVSVGWMSFLPGKKRLFETIYVDDEDIEAFRKLISKGVNVKYQASPSDTQLDMSDYISQ